MPVPDPELDADRPPTGPDTGGGGVADAARLGEPSVILDVVVRAVFHTVIVFALYLHFAGHNQPGGGFIAGLVIGSALVLRLITGHQGVVGGAEVRTEVLFGLGALLVVGTALTSLALGNGLLEHHTWEVKAPVLGKIKWTSALFFDSGIVLIVVGVVAGMLTVFGSEPGRALDTPAEVGDGGTVDDEAAERT